MSIKIRLFVDKAGQPQAEALDADPVGHLVSRLLETDVGGNAEYCSRLLGESSKIVAAKKGAWSVSGNGYGVTIDADNTEISPLYPAKGVKPVTVPTRDFIATLKQWQALAVPKKSKKN